MSENEREEVTDLVTVGDLTQDPIVQSVRRMVSDSLPGYDTVVDAFSMAAGAMAGAIGVATMGPLGAVAGTVVHLSLRHTLKTESVRELLKVAPQVAEKVGHLQEEMGDEAPGASEVASTLLLAAEANETATNKAKKRLIQNAFVNSFDIELYKEGINKHLFDLLEKLEYPELVLLEELSQDNQKNNSIRGVLRRKLREQDKYQNGAYRFLWGRLQEHGLLLSNSHDSPVSYIGMKLVEFIKEPEPTPPTED